MVYKSFDELIEKVKEQQKYLVEESEITREAQEYAKQLIEDAERKANDMKMGAYTYSDEILSSLEEKIKEVIGIIEQNRDSLKGID